MIDFTNCEKAKKTYGGANGNKISIWYEDELYMLKFPSAPTKKTELSYANGCISEYISCHIMNFLGIEAQETILGTYHMNDKEKIVVACKDMEVDGFVLKDFASLKNTVIDSENNGYGTDLSDILDSIDKQQNIDPLKLKDRFWDMFVVDAILGNFDRHNGNWGYLYNQQTDECKLAPVFDCGSCLFPQADKETIKKVLSVPEELRRRTFDYPTSAIKMDGHKINYYDFINNTTDKDCLLSIERIGNRFDMDKIDKFIKSIPYIDDIQREFYSTMLNTRYEKIILPVVKDMNKYNEEEYDYGIDR